MTQEGLPIIISAPSGAGKTTLCQALKKRLPDLHFSVSHTTRPPRGKERDGIDYHFTGRDKFLEMIDHGEFLEWAEIHNHYYGTSRKNIESTLKQGKDLILELDVQGVETLRQQKYEGLYIFILPPSFEELEKRLTERGTEPDEQIKQRLAVGKQEITKTHLYDYTVTNVNIEESVETLLAIINTEKNRKIIQSGSD